MERQQLLVNTIGRTAAQAIARRIFLCPDECRICSGSLAKNGIARFPIVCGLLNIRTLLFNNSDSDCSLIYTMGVKTMNNNLVQISNNQLTTTSKVIAEAFGVLHKNVLAKIQSLEIPTDFSRLNFQPAEYLDEQGKTRKQYTITRDGFTLLAMGFTGKKAMKFKIDFINAFNAMEAELLNRATLKKPTFAETLLGSRELKKENEKLKNLTSSLQTELLKSKPLWRKINRYTEMGLTNAEISRLIGKAPRTVRQYKTEMCHLLLLAPKAHPMQLVLEFNPATVEQ